MDTIQSKSMSLSEMPPERSSETARLVAANTDPKPCYLNLTNNICGLLFVGIITYCCFTKNVTLFTFHPILMALGWIMLMTTAINSITPGDIATEWMPIRLRSARHWVIQLFGGIFIVIGFILIVSHKFKISSSHFVSLHAKFGLASFIFMIVTMLGGLGALYSLKLKHYLAPIYTKLIHASIGLATFCLGVTTICLGFYSTWWSFGDMLRYTCLTLVLIVMVSTVLRPSLKIYFRLKERLENIN